MVRVHHQLAKSHFQNKPCKFILNYSHFFCCSASFKCLNVHMTKRNGKVPHLAGSSPWNPQFNDLIFASYRQQRGRWNVWLVRNSFTYAIHNLTQSTKLNGNHHNPNNCHGNSLSLSTQYGTKRNFAYGAFSRVHPCMSDWWM